MRCEVRWGNVQKMTLASLENIWGRAAMKASQRIYFAKAGTEVKQGDGICYPGTATNFMIELNLKAIWS